MRGVQPTISKRYHLRDRHVLIEPPAIRAAELAGDLTTRLALQEETKSLPSGAVWDYFCESKDVPAGEAWLTEVRRHERDVLSNRR